MYSGSVKRYVPATISGRHYELALEASYRTIPDLLLQAREILQDESNVQPVVRYPWHNLSPPPVLPVSDGEHFTAEVPGHSLWGYSWPIPRSDGVIQDRWSQS